MLLSAARTRLSRCQTAALAAAGLCHQHPPRVGRAIRDSKALWSGKAVGQTIMARALLEKARVERNWMRRGALQMVRPIPALPAARSARATRRATGTLVGERAARDIVVPALPAELLDKLLSNCL